MAVAPQELAGEPAVLSPAEFDALLDARCRRSLDMTLDEFMAARDAGALPDLPVVDHLLLLVGARAG